MTLLEYITDLQSQGLSSEEIFAKAQEFKGRAKPEEVVEEIVEEGNQNDSQTEGADVDQDNVAPQQSDTESISEDGSLVLQPSLSNKQGFGSRQFMSDAMNNVETDFTGKFKSIKLTPEQKEFTKVAKPGESYGEFDDTYDYKYEVKDGNVKYYQKLKTDTEFTEATEKKGDLMGVATVFGHADVDLEKLKKDKLAQKNYDKDFTNYVSNLQIDEEEVEPTNEEIINNIGTLQLNQQGLTNEQKVQLPAFEYNNLSLEDKITKEIKDNSLNKEFSFVEYKDLPFNDKFGISEDYDGDPVMITVGNAYNFGKLSKDVKNLNTDDFFGYLKEKGLADQYTNDVNDRKDDKYNVFNTRGDAKFQADSELGRQRDLSNYFNQYLNKKTQDYNTQLQLNWIKNNPEAVGKTNSIEEAKDKAKKYFLKTYGVREIPLFNPSEIKAYKEKNFPELVENEKQQVLLAKEEKRQRIENNNLQGTFDTIGDSFEAIWDTGRGKLKESAYVFGDLFGLDGMKALKLVENERDILDQADDLSFFYAKGKVAKSGEYNYVRDNAGIIYNTDLGIIETTLSEDELKQINKDIDENGEDGSDYNFRGGVEAGAGLVAGLAYDIAGMYGVGKFTQATKLGKIVNAVKMNPSTFSQMAYYGFSGYASTKKDTYQSLIDAGITDDEAEKISDEAAIAGGLWYSATGLVAPNSAYLNTFQKRLGLNSMYKNALNSYKKTGSPSSYTSSLMQSFKNKIPTTQSGLKTLRGSFQEFGQENLQSAGEKKGINAFVNYRAGEDILNTDYTFQDFWRTSLLSFGAGGAMVGVETRYQSPKKQLQNLFYVGSNYDAVKSRLNTDIINGNISQANADKLLFDGKAVYNQSSGIPSGTDPSIALPSSILMQEISDLENKKKNLDPAFHADVDAEIKLKKTELNNIASQQLDKGSDVIAGQLGTEVNAYKTTTEVETKVNELIANGAKIDEKASTNYGTFLKIKDPETGEIRTEIVVNQEIAAEDRVITTKQHEVLHAVLNQTFSKNPEVAVSVGKDLINQLKQDVASGKIEFKTKEFETRLNSYINDPDYDNPSTLEEAFTLLSEGLTEGHIVINETTGSKIGNFIRRALSALGVKASFKNGTEAINFIKDYNRSVAKGKGLSLGQLKTAKTGAEIDQDIDKSIVDTDIEAVDLPTTKSSKRKLPADTQTYMELDNDVLQQGLVSEIQNEGSNQFTIAQAIVEKNWPLISKSLDIKSETEMDAAKEIVIDQMLGQFQGSGNGKYSPRNTSALAGFSLDPDGDTPSAQVNTYLTETIRRRKPEIDLAIKERTGSSAELNTNTSEEVASVTTETETVKAKKSPKGDAIYNSVLQENLGSDVATAVDTAIEADLLDMNVGDKFAKTNKLGQALGKVLGKAFGLNPEVFTIKSRNIAKKDLKGLTNLRQYLTANAQSDFSNLPDAYDSSGKSTFIPNSILESLYVKDGKGKWKLDSSKTLSDYKKLIGSVNADKPIYRSKDATIAKALAGLSFRNKMFETAVPDPIKRKTTGVKFSKRKGSETINESKDSKANYAKLPITDFKRINSKGKEIKQTQYDRNSDEFIKMQEDLGEFFKDNPELVPFFRTGMTGTKQTHTFGEVGIFDSIFPDLLSKLPVNRKKYNAALKPNKKLIKNVLENVNADNKIKLATLENIFSSIETFLKKPKNKDKEYIFRQWLKDGTKDQNHPLRFLAPFGFYPVDLKTGKLNTIEQTTEEHSEPAVQVGRQLLNAAIEGNLSNVFPIVKASYMQGPLNRIEDLALKKSGYNDKMPQEYYDSVVPLIESGKLDFLPDGMASMIRYSIDNTINPFAYKIAGKDITIGELFVGKPVVFDGLTGQDLEVTSNIAKARANELITAVLTGEIDVKQAKADFKSYQKIIPSEVNAFNSNNEINGAKTEQATTAEEQIEILENYDKAADNARQLNSKRKGISIFDFDDTLAKTKSNVIVTMPNGEVLKISATEFASQAEDLESQEASFDFSEFNKVIKGKKGPLADLALARQGKFGSDNIFVLTARPQQSAFAIKTFLDGIGLNLPLSNITGLENGSAQAKANWVVSKAAEGYNDFYFADDATQNVKAVKEVLNQVDVKSDVQLAKASKRKTFDRVFNDILESSTGIETFKEYSTARAQTVGAKKGRFSFFTTPSAEDFVGLLYKTLGKGKVGDAQFQFYKDNLIDPYNRAEIAVTKAKIAAANSFKALKTNLKTLPKSLSKQTGIGGFTFGQAARVAVWTRQGMEVPGLSKRDLKELNDFVNNNSELNVFADELVKIQKGKPYPKPGQNWLGGNITSDILNDINKSNRKEYLQEWQENVDIIFSDKNMNKLEAAYGPKYVEALRDQLARMKSGSNRPIGGSRIVNQLLDWLNNSVGAVMFLNTRSAVLQTLSAVNFINFGNNNIYKAGKAFANQPQFWKDFKTLMNSPYLVERRNGLKINVSESEIADAVAESSNKVKSGISYLLNKGFIFTRIADSFAIASGGATFYRNQLDAYLKDGVPQKEAEKKAFDDFYAIAEENQQSSNPSKISQQQASGAGRVVLAFANTPMQYARIIKRASQDLINGRGDWKSNVSKIVYYAAIQNIAFNALQNALFAEAFGEDEEEDEEQSNKQGRIANGMADSLLRGLGIQGAAVSALKNSLITIANENDKKSPKFVKAVYDLFDFSPPLDSKFRKLRSGANTITWERENIKNKGFDLNNPAYLASAQIVSGLTNLPLDRAIQKMNNIRAIMSNSSQNWQKVAMALGWSTWDVGLPYYGVDDKVEMTPQMILKEKVTTMKKETSTKQQKEMLLKLGLTKQQIKALKYEEIRVKKIIELQEKNKKK